MTDAPIRVGLIGTGKIAQMMHLPYLAELPEFETVAVTDLSPGTARQVADAFGIATVYESNEALIADPAVEAVIVCNFDHPEVTEQALKAGKHVLVEKPVAFTVEEADHLTAVAEASGLVAMVGYMKLYDAGIDAAADAIAACGALRNLHVHDFAGRFDLADGLYSFLRSDDVPPEALAAGRADVERKVAEALGPSHAGYRDLMIRMLMIGSHDLAVTRHLFGTPERVAYARPVTDWQMLAVLDFPGGLPCVMELGIGARYNHWDENLTVWGTQDELRVEFSHPYHRYGSTLLRHRGGTGDSPVETVTTVSHEPAFRRELAAFAASIRQGAPVRSTMAGGADDIRLMRDIILSMPPRPASRD